MEGFEGFVYDVKWWDGNEDSSPSLFHTYNIVPDAVITLPTAKALGGIITAPFRAVAGAATSVVDYGKSTVRNTYLYLIGGIVIVGILAVFVLGAGTKFMGTVQK